MGNYQIKINIEIEESKNSITSEYNKTADGSITCTISETEAINIDKCENALLKINFEALREALSRHLEEISKKKST